MTGADVVKLLNIAAIVFSLIGATACFWYAWTCRRQDRFFRLYAGMILVYFGLTYLLALIAPIGESFGVWYAVRSGIMTRAGVIALIVLLISWVYVDAGKCNE